MKLKFKTMGVMLDCSRNAVYRPEELKRLISLLAKMGYNMFQLYTEDTYEVEGEPYFGYLRGRYSLEELREIDEFAASVGVELIPCIQTLAHLGSLLKNPVYAPLRDYGDVLLVGEGEDATYALIDKMLASCAKAFRSRRIHIGMDEARALGRGVYLDKHGYVPQDEILISHLIKVAKLAEKHGFRSMIWADAFYLTIDKGVVTVKTPPVSEELKAVFPKNVDLVYWDYSQRNAAYYAEKYAALRRFDESNRPIFAGGSWMWTGITPHNDYSIRMVKSAYEACLENGVDEVIETLWGDDGAEGSPYSVLPSLYYGAALARGITDEEEIRRSFYELVGEDFDKMMALDLPDRIGKGPYGYQNPSKYFLYNDLFRGRMDPCLIKGGRRFYGKAKRTLAAYAREGGDYAYLFDLEAKLCAVLEEKYDLGVRTREAYQKGDRETLATLPRVYRRLGRKVRAFFEAFRFAWMKEKKSHGFEIQEYRLGGMMTRIEDCARMLEDYLSGKLERIEELEEELLPYHPSWEPDRRYLMPVHQAIASPMTF